ncbi:MAG: hypothetical protein FJX75_02030 [Armatimonadetes bacterium]|nr:hypothetical protein [Armatimonadota bacterium]
MRLRLAAAIALVASSAHAHADVSFTVPQYTVPADNAWDHYVAAFALLPPRGELWDRVERVWGEPSVADVEALLRAGSPALAVLRGGLGMPCVPLYVEVGSAGQGPPPPWAAARQMARLLDWEAWLATQRGDYEGAFASSLDGITLGQDLARNGGTLARSVGMVCENIPLHRIRRTVAAAAGDEAALARLVARLQGLEAHEVPYADSLAHSHQRSIAYLRWLRDSGTMTREQFQQRYGTRATGAAVILTTRELDRRYSKAVAIAQGPTWEWVPAPTRPSTGTASAVRPQKARRTPRSLALTPRQLARLGRRFDRILQGIKRWSEDLTLVDSFSPSRYTGPWTVDHLARLRGTLLVAALELRRARTGEYPAVLADLVPGILNSVPVDPWTGQPFRYERISATEYKLYSVGPDRADDGGVEKGPKNTGRYDLRFAAGK